MCKCLWARRQAHRTSEFIEEGGRGRGREASGRERETDVPRVQWVPLSCRVYRYAPATPPTHTQASPLYLHARAPPYTHTFIGLSILICLGVRALPPYPLTHTPTVFSDLPSCSSPFCAGYSWPFSLFSPPHAPAAAAFAPSSDAHPEQVGGRQAGRGGGREGGRKKEKDPHTVALPSGWPEHAFDQLQARRNPAHHTASVP